MPSTGQKSLTFHFIIYTIKSSRLSLTADKNIANVSKHGVDMSAAAEFDFETAVTWTDTRKIYGETRTIAVGFIARSSACFGFYHARPEVTVITLRKANRKESAAYHDKR